MSFVAIKKLRSLRLSNNNKGFTITNKWACKSLWNRLLDWVDWFSGLLIQVLSGFNRRSRGRFSSIATGFNRSSEGQFDRYSGFLIQVLSGFNRRSRGRFSSIATGFNRSSEGQFDRYSGFLIQVLSGFNRSSSGRFSSIATGFNRTSESQFDRYSGFLIQVLSGFNRRSSGRFDRFSSGLAVVPLVSTGRVRVSLTDLVGSIAENTIRFNKVAFTDTVNCVLVRADIYSISKVASCKMLFVELQCIAWYTVLHIDY